jgi:hypothetical protein
VVAGVFVADEEKILVAEGNDSQRSLGAIVVQRHRRVVEENGKLVPLTKRVTDRDAELALGRVLPLA